MTRISNEEIKYLQAKLLQNSFLVLNQIQCLKKNLCKPSAKCYNCKVNGASIFRKERNFFQKKNQEQRMEINIFFFKKIKQTQNERDTIKIYKNLDLPFFLFNIIMITVLFQMTLQGNFIDIHCKIRYFIVNRQKLLTKIVLVSSLCLSQVLINKIEIQERVRIVQEVLNKFQETAATSIYSKENKKQHKQSDNHKKFNNHKHKTIKQKDSLDQFTIYKYKVIIIAKTTQNCQNKNRLISLQN
ncbi:unnamed protein product [Paramecium sonneborni]|uniref:Transmembrane protein n=1 Tax=Paramecium sonneborni TaxID=65129 RepID=A0A8S1RE17_9CILI|nr:unnamed protein product [Paramecium sonneborni]